MIDELERLEEEHEMLNKKIKVLGIYLSASIVNNVSCNKDENIRLELIGIQYNCMIAYLKVLELRIKEAKKCVK